MPTRNHLLGLSTLLLAACGGDSSIMLSMSTREIPADGRDVIKLSADVLIRGNPSKDGRVVTFSVDSQAGSFERFKPVTSITARTSGGIASVDFYPGTTEGDFNINASTQDANRASMSDRRRLSIGSPTPVSSRHFRFQCENRIVGALVPGIGEIRIPCTVRTGDRNGDKLPYARVTFHTEGGGYFEEEPVSSSNWDDDLRRFWYVIPPGSDRPVNVDPHPSESSLELVDGSHNPRDGLVTMVATVHGEEWFRDDNNNGVRDPGEPFDDLGEPFLDIDDDGEYEEEQFLPGYDWFADNNGNGVRDGPNGRWDTGVTIGRITHILWVGAPSSSNTGWGQNNLQMCRCGSASVEFWAMDSNFNPMPAFRTTDRVDYSYPGTSFFQVNPTGDSPLQDDHRFSWGSGSYDFQESLVFAGIDQDSRGIPTGRKRRFDIEDARMHTDCNDCGDAEDSRCTAYTTTTNRLQAQIRYTPAPGQAQVSTENHILYINTIDYFNEACPGGS